MRLYRYENAYTCPNCKAEWCDDSSSKNNDECPKCGTSDIEPESSTDYDTDDSGKADIVVIIENGLCERVVAPKGLSVLVLDRDVDSADGDDLVRDEDGKECVPTWFKEPGEANADEVVDSVRGLLREALSYEAARFDGTADELNVSGADLVDWFTQWRERARSALAADDFKPAALNELTPDGVSRIFGMRYGAEVRAERCLLVMTGTDMGTITETDVTVLECAARNDFEDIGGDVTRVTWPAVWIKQEPQEQTGFWISTADDHIGEDPSELMVGASPWLRNLWRDARAAGFSRIELTWG